MNTAETSTQYDFLCNDFATAKTSLILKYAALANVRFTGTTINSASVALRTMFLPACKSSWVKRMLMMVVIVVILFGATDIATTNVGICSFVGCVGYGVVKVVEVVVAVELEMAVEQWRRSWSVGRVCG
eukprot:m.88837 g.88837  ORF g.88837 m.88837 type:complete len:129 (-) comp8816_c7_seq1:35-421(-)